MRTFHVEPSGPEGRVRALDVARPEPREAFRGRHVNARVRLTGPTPTLMRKHWPGLHPATPARPMRMREAARTALSSTAPLRDAQR